ncbi:OLC1v1036136C2 [Oldenlandia corymbosa var. corymbosa]|uniref:OLC1v1036136C2 n=1 Tax=Oldenlandia corymbosa var. corymbosa TaxID=529605 RepID=A0AAV1CVT7_OLDCO|nr:OLC1v1036136C2 [Oldenlandia corymbosa var. corymbosa]
MFISQAPFSLRKFKTLSSPQKAQISAQTIYRTMASSEAKENGSTMASEIDENSQSDSQPRLVSDATEKADEEQAADFSAAEAGAEDVDEAQAQENDNSNNNVNKWPGWPGDCVYRLVVPVLKVGSIIGRKGELIKRMCEETRARIRVLEGPTSSPDRVVLVSGKEEPDVPMSPAMDAVIRIFKRVSGLPEAETDANAFGAAGVAFCSIRLLVASTQAINLIGKQGSLIKSIQESSGATVRVLSTDEVPAYVSSEERIVELQGEALKVLKALEAVVKHLRKFLVDHSVLPLFEKKYTMPPTQERPAEPWSEKPYLRNTSQIGGITDYSPLSVKRDSSYFERESHLESQNPTSLSFYGQDPSVSGLRYPRPGPIVTQVAQTIQIPITYAEDIIGVGGANIAYIRRTSGAILTVQECGSVSNEITVEIKGTSAQVQTAQQLIQVIHFFLIFLKRYLMF